MSAVSLQACGGQFQRLHVTARAFSASCCSALLLSQLTLTFLPYCSTHYVERWLALLYASYRSACSHWLLHAGACQSSLRARGAWLAFQAAAPGDEARNSLSEPAEADGTLT